MKVIIAGSRSITSQSDVDLAIGFSGFNITEVVSGKCRGVDALGEAWAKKHGVPVRDFPAEWEFYGKKAGPFRNEQMATYAEALIAVRAAGKSDGTDDMIKRARKRGLKVFVFQIHELIFEFVKDHTLFQISRRAHQTATVPIFHKRKKP